MPIIQLLRQFWKWYAKCGTMAAMSIITVFLILAGFVALVVGADFLVRGASRLALVLGVSPLVVGLTVVAFGTSAPEAAVSVFSAALGKPGIAVGNIVGSNIFNILFVLGLAAIVAPLIVDQRLVRLEVPIMIGTSFLLFALSLDGLISRLDGLLLFAGVISYTIWAIRKSRSEGQNVRKEYEAEFGLPEAEDKSSTSIAKDIGSVLFGTLLLVGGSRALVTGAVDIAELFGVSELVIGLTIISIGTSLPEVATSVLATIRGERDIAVGNAIGSNLFNILAVFGLTGLVAPNGVGVPEAALLFDMPVMIVVAIACLPIFFTGGKILRWEGALFFLYYWIYLAYVILTASAHPALPAFSQALLLFALPATAVALVWPVWRTWRKPVEPGT